MSLIALLLSTSLWLLSVAKAATPSNANGPVGSTTPEGTTIWQTLLQQSKVLAPMERFEMAQSACIAGSAIGCSTAGELIVSGATDTFDAPKAVELFQQGCDLGNANACQGVGLMLVQGIGIAADIEKGQSTIRKSCEANNAMACANLGLMLTLDRFGAPNTKLAEIYFLRAQSLQPDNELAQRGLAELGSTRQAIVASGSPNTNLARTELRGRQINLSANGSNDFVAMSQASKPETRCSNSVIEALNSLSRKIQTRPSWDTPTPTTKVPVSDLESIGLMLALPQSDRLTLTGPDESEPAVPLIQDCIAENRAALNAVLSQTWTVAPETLGVQAAFQLLAKKDTLQNPSPAPQTILLILVTGETGQNDAAGSTMSLASKVIAQYEYTCDSSRGRVVFGIQFDRQSKLVGYEGFAGKEEVPLVATHLASVAQKLACTSESERYLWTKLSGLEAALSLRFEKDQQQTP
ncbi:MAG: hypothetical protein CFE32_05225 [Alphaproteobacteria bacterium PA3]|nr:MAG: hypothetical protein CFE32_05225 [Alphaproteobacteria bacterium PA3]